MISSLIFDTSVKINDYFGLTTIFSFIDFEDFWCDFMVPYTLLDIA